MATKQIYQIKITLQDIEPHIWRRIQVPNTYTFWELHSAVQDAFGWTNSHLHKFTYTDAHTDGIINKPSVMGIPLEPELEDEEPPLPGWKYKIKPYIEGETSKIEYTYDFGDNWQHTIELEEILESVKGFKYPFCVDGARACPPEDCGGPHGYANLLEIIFDPSDPVYEDMRTWVDSRKGCTFEPEQFYSAQVRFANPAKRFKECFEE
ncbi:MAG: plasmid pRiA4b ORF-3 family protein [Desulfuromonadaceae bacterium]|nr:plasmid pRiA4b ORF-3 family protein [Desulfuromonadaceae bacterium]MDD2847610.1 plasmid pRiA4b ORF-3 family protein [Desulfuromonadaceae bacterium]MDD4131144.1 plasmid pRiA4b ORF-3 family protein [Desulfuromonadaceae bacterium]